MKRTIEKNRISKKIQMEINEKKRAIEINGKGDKK